MSEGDLAELRSRVMLDPATRPSGCSSRLATGSQPGPLLAQIRKHTDFRESPTSSEDRAVPDDQPAPRLIVTRSWQRRLRLTLSYVRLIPSAFALSEMAALPAAIAHIQPVSSVLLASADEHPVKATRVGIKQNSLDEPKVPPSWVAVLWTTILVKATALFGVNGPAGMKTTLGQA